VASADKLIELFNEAKAKPAGAERERFLAEACREDSQLQEQVLSLLQAEADDSDADFLQGTPLVRTAAWVAEKPGDRIGRYKLLQQLGEGGCGVVYMAEQEEPVRRRVALKVVKLGMDTRSVIARFEAERQALALMDHPNIAKVLDAGATNTGRPYFVMELVRGIKITDYCDQNSLTTEQRLELFTQVCHAVQHAHQKGIIHRDIKPSNILVAQHDSVAVPKVIDFGIAKATAGQQLTEKTVFTAFEQFIGTPAYMSPEQAQLSGLDIDTRTDIYALGVLLYELLTGRTPFDQKELLAAGLDEMRRTIREREPPKPSTRLGTLVATELTSTANHRQTEPPKLIHRVRGDLDWIVMKALEKDRTRRYETANGLATDVQRHLKNEPVSARPPGNFYRLQKLIQRNRLGFAAAAACAFALVLALVVLSVSNLRIRRERNEKESALQAKGVALQSAHASEQRATDGLFVALRQQARARRHSRQMGRRFESLAAIVEATAIRRDPALRDEAIAALAMSDVRPGPIRTAPATNTVALAWTALFDRCASLDRDGVIRVWNADGRELQRMHIGPVPTAGPRINHLLFSPDGRLLAFFRSGTAPQVWRLADGQPLLREPPRSCTTLDFSPDGRQFILADADWIQSFDDAKGRELGRWQADGGVGMVLFSPDGNRVAASVPDRRTVCIFDAATGDKLSDLPAGISLGGVICWHPDGSRLAVVGTGGNIEIWNVASRRRVATLRGHAPEVTALSFHPDGELLASVGWDSTARLWESGTGRQVMQIPPLGRLQFSGDGQWLGALQSPARVQLLQVSPPEEYHTLVSSRGVENRGSYGCTVSPVHPLLAVAMEDGVRVWDLNARAEVAFLESGSTLAVLFAPDGRSLLTSGAEGLNRWPIHGGAKDADLSIGPPEKFQLPFTPRRIAASRDGKLIGVVSEKSGPIGAALLDAEQGTVRRPFLSHPNVTYVALSPDARWLASSGWHSSDVRLWDTESGKLVLELVPGSSTRVSFTPDSRRLVIATSGEFAFLDLDSQKQTMQWPREIGLHPGDVVFSPDDRLMAVEMSPAVIHLKDVATGRTVARLEDPFGDTAAEMTFSADGTMLIVFAPYAGAIHIWDLRAIRAQLKTIGLDWDWPEFPPSVSPEASRTSLGGPTLKVKVLNERPR